ncbi:uncharacterized protein LOC114350100 isoform X1 [Ostrinia furnacalis]|uniref:uncharacterized protein LOC114350100 isoform X1 n=1 Tax=Ostrinia furnacalis TaxID=93504 RepID=UPI001038F013|nr:uncharacterized protein LOC114350100 isoform X1 [Ostrinia furnacalis]
MEPEHLCTLHARVVRKSDAPKPQQVQESDKWRRQCGCIRTSEKLKKILKSFPAAPPPSPSVENISKRCINSFGLGGKKRFETTCISAYCSESSKNQPLLPAPTQGTQESNQSKLPEVGSYAESKLGNKSWQIVADLVHLVQLTVTATALALYYVIYCYMQLIYYTLRSALYFHNADGPMKITIGVVTITSLIIGFNLLIRMEKLIGIYLF